MISMATKRSAFAWSPVRKLMKNSGANMVSREAVDFLIRSLEEYGKSMTIKALTLAKHSGRKKISKADIALAKQYM